MSQPRVLVTAAHHWRSPFQVGTQHLARGFVAAGWDVAYVSDPISPLHLAGGLSPDLRDRIAGWRSGGLRDLDGHLWAYVPAALVTPRNLPVLRSGRLHRHWHRLSVPDLRGVVRDQGFGDVDLIVFGSVLQSFWLEALPHRRSVLRVSDQNSGFGRFTRAMLALEGDLARKVDIVAFTAWTLEPHVRSLGATQTVHLPNGVDVDHFVGGNRALPDDLRGIPRPIAIYVGGLEEWFDFGTLNALAAALPGVSFVLIGPDHLARRRLTARPNLHLLGRRSFETLPRYLHNADVGLIPFDVHGHAELVHRVNPLKLYEYLACGLPVVATRWDELERLGSPAILASSVEEHVDGIRRALAGDHDPEAARRFARAADWRTRVETLIHHLDALPVAP